MEARQVIQLRSSEAVALLTRSSKKSSSLFYRAIIKINLLHKLARKGQIYPCVYLLKIKQRIQALKIELAQMKQRYHRLLRKRGVPSMTFQAQRRISFVVGQSTVGGLIQALIEWDELMCLLTTARIGGLFAHRAAYFREKKQMKFEFTRHLGLILQYRTRHIPEVKLSDYLEQTPCYKKAARNLGGIDTLVLYHAIDLFSNLYVGSCVKSNDV